MLSFYGMWSNDTHGSDGFPPDGHFSAILGVSHENGYSLWAPGIKATEGVKEVAENGKLIFFLITLLLQVKSGKIVILILTYVKYSLSWLKSPINLLPTTYKTGIENISQNILFCF